MPGEGTLDLAIVHKDPPATMRRHRVLERPFGVAIRPTHPLGTAKKCTLQDLDGLGVLAHARDPVPSEYDRLLRPLMRREAHRCGSSPDSQRTHSFAPGPPPQWASFSTQRPRRDSCRGGSGCP
ncbi:hypothetical protein [Arthrobacter sp. StoSoilB22]|uniref:hypothetical protein n=1 Tax=Arthrobacter sp. StoSoilB22 TaxID=2830996 RepID=UPI00336A592A